MSAAAYDAGETEGEEKEKRGHWSVTDEGEERRSLIS